MLKPYIFNYSSTLTMCNNSNMVYDKKKQVNLTKMGDVYIKKYFNGPTVETKSIEPSDEDTCNLGPTFQTLSIEESDNDTYFFGPTISTESLEESDDDIFVIN